MDKEIERLIKSEVKKEVKKWINEIKDDILKEIYKLVREQYEEIKKEEIGLEKKIIKPEVSALLSLIEILEEKEVFTEEELDQKFRELDPKDYEKLKLTYALYHAKKDELKQLTEKNESNQSEAGNTQKNK